jgi:lipopolysaccharide export system protein LptC
MPVSEHFYSRLVAWLKILLPLAALALLSTLFLLSKNIDPTTTIPFTTIDLRERAASEQVTAPEFAGATDDGDLIAFRAVSARPDPERATRMFAETLDARIELLSGSIITFRAAGGVVDETSDRVELDGDVIIESSIGYIVKSDRLISGMREIHAETPGPITGTGPPGAFSSGRMLITSGDADDSVQMLFTDGVKLLYVPPDTKE